MKIRTDRKWKGKVRPRASFMILGEAAMVTIVIEKTIMSLKVLITLLELARILFK